MVLPTGQVQLSVRSGSCSAEMQSCAVGMQCAMAQCIGMLSCAMAQCKLEPFEMYRGGTILGGERVQQLKPEN